MPATTSAERGRDVRRRLLGAAVELIPELGWNAVSTRILAERAGVAPGLVHYHFTSLQALLREAAVAAMRELVESSGPLLEHAASLEDGLDVLLGSLDAFSGTDATSLLFVEATLAATRDEALRAALATLLDDFRRDLADWLGARGQPAPADTAAVLAAAIDGMMLHRALNPALTSDVVAPVLHRLVASRPDRHQVSGARLRKP